MVATITLCLFTMRWRGCLIPHEPRPLAAPPHPFFVTLWPNPTSIYRADAPFVSRFICLSSSSTFFPSFALPFPPSSHLLPSLSLRPDAVSRPWLFSLFSGWLTRPIPILRGSPATLLPSVCRARRPRRSPPSQKGP